MFGSALARTADIGIRQDIDCALLQMFAQTYHQKVHVASFCATLAVLAWHS